MAAGEIFGGEARFFRAVGLTLHHQYQSADAKRLRIVLAVMNIFEKQDITITPFRLSWGDVGKAALAMLAYYVFFGV